MPINIYKEKNNERLAWLCDKSWDLPYQISELENWLEKTGKHLPIGQYVADIGFGIRNEANGGGGVISKNMMGIMSKIGMEIYLSEYPSK
ncbi:hypothetical protein MWU65_16745 [Cellulophaga sp. F20128]|uniref:hypothetical protein n=1 Tax=Cellulophaga sp. F20128 TaxID=2926413 RepID=UPI001FF3F7E2|nr:hypothetical protein [Cellulophaga sp. F20128]MCK0158842.1 hypothetical protein [Cellulophaga sp. F20128]